MEEDWDVVAATITDVVSDLHWHHFVIVEYVDPSCEDAPYAQAAVGAGGIWCEAVSELFLPADVWPIDAEVLRGSGWTEPSESAPNWWWPDPVAPGEAVQLLLASLRDARGCTDPRLLRWRTGAFPPGPGGGEEIKGGDVVPFRSPWHIAA